MGRRHLFQGEERVVRVLVVRFSAKHGAFSEFAKRVHSFGAERATTPRRVLRGECSQLDRGDGGVAQTRHRWKQNERLRHRHLPRLRVEPRVERRDGARQPGARRVPGEFARRREDALEMRPVQWSREGLEHGGDRRVREDVEGLEAHLEWRQRGRVLVRGGALRRSNRRRRRFLRRIESPPRRSRRRVVLVRSENPPLDVVHVHAKRDAVRRVHLRANVPKLDAKRLGGGRRARRLGAEDEGQSPRLERKRRRGAVRAAPRDAGRDVTRRTRGDGRGGRRRRLGETHRAEGEVASAAIERARGAPEVRRPRGAVLLIRRIIPKFHLLLRVHEIFLLLLLLQDGTLRALARRQERLQLELVLERVQLQPRALQLGGVLAIVKLILPEAVVHARVPGDAFRANLTRVQLRVPQQILRRRLDRLRRVVTSNDGPRRVSPPRAPIPRLRRSTRPVRLAKRPHARGVRQTNQTPRLARTHAQPHRGSHLHSNVKPEASRRRILPEPRATSRRHRERRRERLRADQHVVGIDRVVVPRSKRRSVVERRCTRRGVPRRVVRVVHVSRRDGVHAQAAHLDAFASLAHGGHPREETAKGTVFRRRRRGRRLSLPFRGGRGGGGAAALGRPRFVRILLGDGGDSRRRRRRVRVAGGRSRVRLGLALHLGRGDEEGIHPETERGDALSVVRLWHVGELDVHGAYFDAEAVEDRGHQGAKVGRPDALDAVASALPRRHLRGGGEGGALERERALRRGRRRPFVLGARRRGERDALEGDDDGMHAKQRRLPAHLELEERDGALANGERELQMVERVALQSHVLETNHAAP